MHLLPRSVLPRAQCKPRHLRGDADAAFIQQADGVLVALALLAQQVLLGHLDVVEVDDAGAAGADAELLLFLGDGEARRALLHHERRDALVALARVQVREHHEQVRFHAVRDPHLVAGDAVAGGGLDGLGGHGEGVAAGHRLAETEAADGVGGQARQPLALDVGRAVAHDGGVDQRIVHVAHDTDRWIHPRQLFNRYDRRCKVHACAAVLLGNLDAHQTLLEELLDHGGIH